MEKSKNGGYAGQSLAGQGLATASPGIAEWVDERPLHERLAETARHENEAKIRESGIRPFAFKVMVRPDDSETETLKQYSALAKAGFKMADESKERGDFAVMTGTLIALSPVAFTYETFPEGTRFPKPGDRVAFAKYAGFMLKGRDGTDYRVMEDKDIAAILDF